MTKSPRRQDPAKKTSKEEQRLHTKEATWEWRERYRVWDANRKVFLYPENWLEPDRVLPVACLVALRQLAAALRARCAALRRWVRNPTLARPKGVSVLFTGKNRAGALVAAQTLARDLRMDLYRIDLSRVVSKYIGETEKNLRQVFDAAQKADTVLLFDEADALLGTRTEVDHLLQRIERFGSLAILSTNRRRGLDEALFRRFHSVIRVPN